MKSVLLTGASGFIGRHCVPLLLKKGYQVHAIDLGPESRAGSVKNVHWHALDLFKEDHVSRLLSKIKPTHLLHFAWYTQHQKYWTSMENLRWVQASLILLNRFIMEGGKRVVTAGTCAEYDWTKGVCIEGKTPLEPATLYGAAKRALGLIQEAYAKEAGISSAWGRIFYLYGPHESPGRLVASVINSLLKGEPIACSHARQKRDFLFVEDVSSAFVALLECDVQGAVNIGSGKAVSLKSVLLEISRKIGRPDLIKFAKKTYKENDPALLVADTTRLNKEVHWHPHISLDEGLDRTIRWWRL